MKRTTLLLTHSLLCVALSACAIDDTDIFEDPDLRGFEIDAWDLHAPIALPHFDSCEDYWAETCGELTPEQCSIARDRDACMPATSKGVVVFDVFGETFDEFEWTAVSVGDQTTSIGKNGSATAACDTMTGVEPEECLALAELAQTVAAKAPELLEVFPEGGFAGLTIRDGHPVDRTAAGEPPRPTCCSRPPPRSAGCLRGSRTSGAIGHANGIVEDDAMYMLSMRPNGSISVSSKRAVFQQGPSEEARLRKLNPNGRVVFVSTRANYYGTSSPQIFVQPVGATTPPTQLTQDWPAPKHPAWSPDGRYIAYVAQTFAVPTDQSIFFVDYLKVIDLNGNEVASYSPYAFGHAKLGYPEWSPDGSGIMFTAHDNWDDRELRVLKFAGPHDWWNYSVDTLVPAAVGPDDPRPTDAVYSHDGSTVYFHADATNYTGGLFQMPAAGGVPVRLNGNGTPIRRGYQVSISNDGARLIFNSEMWRENLPGYLDEELLQLDLQSGVMTRLTSQSGNQYGWFAFNGLADETVMQSSVVAGGTQRSVPVPQRHQHSLLQRRPQQRIRRLLPSMVDAATVGGSRPRTTHGAS